MTAVEWLEKMVKSMLVNGCDLGKNYPSLLVHIEQAKEIEKQQIIDAHISGYDSSGESAEDYYQYYYGSKGSAELSKVEENTSFDTSSKTEMIKKAEWLLDELNKNK